MMSETQSAYVSIETLTASETERLAERDAACAETSADLQHLQTECVVGAETAEARNIRLGEFVEAHFADVCPLEFRDEATQECQLFEDDCRELFEDPTLLLSEDDATDPEFKLRISQLSQKIENDAEIATLTDDVREQETVLADRQASLAKQETTVATSTAERNHVATENPDIPNTVDGSAAMLRQEQQETTQLRASLGLEGNMEEAKNNDLGLISSLDQLRTEHGTIGALHMLLKPDALQTPEMREKVQRTLVIADQLINAVPGKADVVTQLLDRSSINLMADAPAAIFAGFLAETDKSDDLTEAEREEIRKVIGQAETDFETGSDAKQIARSKEQVIDPETGKVISEEYIHNSVETMAELRPNLGTYMHGERMIISTKDGMFDRDVTGWSPEDIGLLAETMDMYRFTESKGITGFVESISNTHLQTITSGPFDRRAVLDLRQTLNALVGGGKGYDGEVFLPEEKGLLLTTQMRAFTDDDQVIEWHNDEADSQRILQAMGMRDASGHPNLDVIRAFGAYTQENLGAEVRRADAQTHLHGLFPDVVKPVADQNMAA